MSKSLKGKFSFTCVECKLTEQFEGCDYDDAFMLAQCKGWGYIPGEYRCENCRQSKYLRELAESQERKLKRMRVFRDSADEIESLKEKLHRLSNKVSAFEKKVGLIRREK